MDAVSCQPMVFAWCDHWSTTSIGSRGSMFWPTNRQTPIKKGPRKSIMDRYQSDVPRFNDAPHYASAAPYHTEHPPYESRHGFRDPDPRSTHAFLVGGVIASLAAAASLIHDANIPAAQVHILESSTLTGGS